MLLGIVLAGAADEVGLLLVLELGVLFVVAHGRAVTAVAGSVNPHVGHFHHHVDTVTRLL